MSPARVRLLLWGFWLLPALVGVLGLRLVPSRLNPGLGWGALVLSQLLIWMPWALWAALVARVSDALPFERGGIARALLAHLALATVVVSAQILLINTVSAAFGMAESRGLVSTLSIGLRSYGDMLLVVYFALVGAHAALRAHERWQQAALQAARLDQDLAEARLLALRAQLNPHFLFNALNSVVALIDHDPPAAQRVTVRLAELLRATLAAGDAHETTLRQELALTARYLEIEHVRFADRLSVRWVVDDGLDDARLPAFTLQPLVENAIRHGITRRAGAGILEVHAQRQGQRVRLTVRDDGVGLHAASAHAEAAPGAGDGAGIALANLRARLERLYGAEASLTLRSRAEGGTDAVVELPWRAGAGAGV